MDSFAWYSILGICLAFSLFVALLIYFVVCPWLKTRILRMDKQQLDEEIDSDIVTNRDTQSQMKYITQTPEFRRNIEEYPNLDESKILYLFNIVYVCMRACASECAPVCECVCTRVRHHMYMCVCAITCTCVCAPAHVLVCVCTCVLVRMCMCSFVYACACYFTLLYFTSKVLDVCIYIYYCFLSCQPLLPLLLKQVLTIEDKLMGIF